MKTSIKTILVVLAILLGQNSMATGHGHDQSFGPQNVQSTSVCVIPAIDGEHVPFPLRQANTKFELSPNQTYVLNGTLVQLDGAVYFKVDFTTQPWLATEKLLQFPYFPVDSMTAKDVYKYSGKLIQIAVVAQSNEPKSSGDEDQTASMKLSVILNPVAL